jgi:hypothetical protein
MAAAMAAPLTAITAGERIKRLRGTLGLTQVQFAELMRVFVCFSQSNGEWTVESVRSGLAADPHR